MYFEFVPLRDFLFQSLKRNQSAKLIRRCSLTPMADWYRPSPPPNKRQIPLSLSLRFGPEDSKPRTAQSKLADFTPTEVVVHTSSRSLLFFWHASTDPLKTFTSSNVETSSFSAPLFSCSGASLGLSSPANFKA